MTAIDIKSIVNKQHNKYTKTRNVARVEMELYEDLTNIINDPAEDSAEGSLKQILEKGRQLSIFSFATSKTMDADTKEIITKAVNLPPALQHFDEDRDFTFTLEQERQIYAERFNRQLPKQSSYSNTRPGRYGSQQQRGQGFPHHGLSRPEFESPAIF